MFLEKLIRTLLFFTLISSCLANAQLIEVDEYGNPIRPIPEEKVKLPQKKRYRSGGYTDIKALRQSRRVGIHMQGAGPAGVLGTQIELNFTRDMSFNIGFGGGSGYQSFFFSAKNVLRGRAFAPYWKMGYARWYTPTQQANLSEVSPSVLRSNLITDSERRSGEFGFDLLTPSLGIQYVQLSGPWVGAGFFVEINFLTSLQRLSVYPTGSLGGSFYF